MVRRSRNISRIRLWVVSSLSISHTTRPIQDTPDPHFLSGVSLPRVLFGDNVQLIEEQSQIDEAIYLVNQFLTTVHWIPTVDFGAGTLFRVDATYNHPVGDRAYDYIKALFNLDGDYPQRKTRPWKYSGVQFYSEATTTTFYDLLKKHQTLSASGFAS